MRDSEMGGMSRPSAISRNAETEFDAAGVAELQEVLRRLFTVQKRET